MWSSAVINSIGTAVNLVLKLLSNCKWKMEYGSALNLQSFSRPVRGDCFYYSSKLDYIELHRNSIPQLTLSVKL